MTSALCGQARQRTIHEMQSLAAQHIGNTAATRGSIVSTPPLGIVYANDELTVIGSCDAGYAIVVNDDNKGTVVGYSTSPFNVANTALLWYLQAAEEALEQIGDRHHETVVPTAPFKTSVAPLLTTAWNQSEPYNNLCPNDSKGKHYPSGCVATALAQILYYHQYPTTGKGQKQYSFQPSDGIGQLLSANFGETTYQWSMMKDVYASGNYSDEEATAVATLMLHCGVAVEMQYTPTGSGAYSKEARVGMITYFGYHPNMGIAYRAYYSQKEWMNMLYSEINLNRPVYYAGSDASRGGHAFVIDGYAQDGMVHVNWGWGPTGGDGYYDIALLNPSGYQFSVSQSMLTGFDLPDADIAYESHIVCETDMSASLFASMLTVDTGTKMWNLNGFNWTGEIGVILKSDASTYVLASKTASKVAERYNVLSNIDGTLSAMYKLPADITDGEYRLFIASKDERDTDWRLVRRPEGVVSSYLVTVDNGKITTLVPDTNDTWPRISTAIVHTNIHTVNHGMSRLYDLQGRELSVPTQKGIYIMNGKKVVK